MDNTTRIAERTNRFLPHGVPKYVRCYDNGGPDMEGGSVDRYTVCYTGKTATEHYEGEPNHYPFVCMSGSPFHPQGFSMHDSNPHHPVDIPQGSSWPVAVGRKCHLGKRIDFQDLPEDCQKLVLTDYKEIWGLDNQSDTH